VGGDEGDASATGLGEKRGGWQGVIDSETLGTVGEQKGSKGALPTRAVILTNVPKKGGGGCVVRMKNGRNPAPNDFNRR